MSASLHTSNIIQSSKIPSVSTNAIFTDIQQFANFLELSPTNREIFLKQISQSTFAFKVPTLYAEKIEKNNLNDPLLLQILPTVQENIITNTYTADPLDEKNYNPIPSVIHKYESRILITATGACNIHCRYCFRKNFDYQKNIYSEKQWARILDYIHHHPKINEVVLSGGDPLTLNNRRLFSLLDNIDAVEQIRYIRLHSRHAANDISRLDNQLIEKITQLYAKVILVLHINHPNEIDTTETQRFRQIHQAGVTLLNQSVLLKNINDDANTLALLSHKIFQANIIPYYLHMFDKVQGANHFNVGEEKSKQLYQKLLAKLPGYLVPKLVQEQHGKAHKTPITPSS